MRGMLRGLPDIFTGFISALIGDWLALFAAAYDSGEVSRFESGGEGAKKPEQL